MILCHCRAVSDREVRSAVDCGARDLDDVARACGAGGDCGSCQVSIEAVLDEPRVRVLVSTPA